MWFLDYCAAAIILYTTWCSYRHIWLLLDNTEVDI